MTNTIVYRFCTAGSGSKSNVFRLHLCHLFFLLLLPFLFLRFIPFFRILSVSFLFLFLLFLCLYLHRFHGLLFFSFFFYLCRLHQVSYFSSPLPHFHFIFSVASFSEQNCLRIRNRLFKVLPTALSYIVSYL